MKNKKPTPAILLLTTSILLSSCASTPSPQQEIKKTEFISTIPVCDVKIDCEAKWEAAQLWVANNAGYKIQTATNVVIETFNPTRDDTYLAAKITKEPLGGGKYKIVATLWCNNMFGCNPDKWGASVAFNKSINELKN